MMPAHRIARPRIVLVLTSLIALSLSACSDSLLESNEAGFTLADPLEKHRAAEVRQHQRWPDHPVSSAHKQLRPPRVVGVAIDPDREPLPVMSLMRVAIDLYPPIDCDNPPEWLMAPGSLDFPAPLAAERLADLGTPVRSAEVWVVPGSRDGAYVDVSVSPGSAEGRAVAMEARLSGVAPEFQYRMPFDSVFQFGPEWFGLPLRQVGVDRSVVFPPTQDCVSVQRAQDDRLPTRVIVYGPFDQGSAPDKYLRIAADVPITARVIEACPVTLRQRNELIEVRSGAIYRPPSKKWRFTATVSGQCERGEVRFEFDPLEAHVM